MTPEQMTPEQIRQNAGRTRQQSDAHRERYGYPPAKDAFDTSQMPKGTRVRHGPADDATLYHDNKQPLVPSTSELFQRDKRKFRIEWLKQNPSATVADLEQAEAEHFHARKGTKVGGGYSQQMPYSQEWRKWEPGMPLDEGENR